MIFLVSVLDVLLSSLLVSLSASNEVSPRSDDHLHAHFLLLSKWFARTDEQRRTNETRTPGPTGQIAYQSGDLCDTRTMSRLSRREWTRCSTDGEKEEKGFDVTMTLILGRRIERFRCSDEKRILQSPSQWEDFSLAIHSGLTGSFVSGEEILINPRRATVSPISSGAKLFLILQTCRQRRWSSSSRTNVGHRFFAPSIPFWTVLRSICSRKWF